MSDVQYPLTRGVQQMIRVGILQNTWHNVLGYLIHPQIPLSAVKIADVATATGLWLCELAKLRPDLLVLDGFDVSPASFIESAALAERVALRVCDATNAVPEAFKGKYDVVHIRLVVSVVHNDDPSSFIKHCMELLRPGGYLQWEECDPLKTELHVAQQIPRPSNLEDLQQGLLDLAPKTWIGNLPKLLERHGFNVVAVDCKEDSPWQRKLLTTLFCELWNEVASTVLDSHGPPNAGPEMRSRVKVAMSEVMQGSTMTNFYQCVVAQKTIH